MAQQHAREALKTFVEEAGEDAETTIRDATDPATAIVEAAILPQAIGIMGAREMCYTGEFWDAAKAEWRGLLNAVVPPERFREEVRAWAQRVASKSPLALETQKEIINQWMTAPLEAAIEHSINTVVINWLTRDQKEGMGAFLEKRPARFTGE